MRDAIQIYLNAVLQAANLCNRDERRVRGELMDHLNELTDLASKESLTQEELFAMLNDKFGNPQTIGSAIAAAKGRFRTYLKKQKRRLPISLAIGLLLAFPIRWAVAEEFQAQTSAAAPAIPQGSRLLIFKLASAFHPGDVIVFQTPDRLAELGIVKSVSQDSASLLIARNGESDQRVPREQVIGRVILNTR